MLGTGVFDFFSMNIQVLYRQLNKGYKQEDEKQCHFHIEQVEKKWQQYWEENKTFKYNRR